MQLTYPVLKAIDVPARYNVHGFPTLIIIDQDGNMHDVHVGYSKTLRADVGKIIKELLVQGAKARPPQRDNAASSDERSAGSSAPAQ